MPEYYPQRWLLVVLKVVYVINMVSNITVHEFFWETFKLSDEQLDSNFLKDELRTEPIVDLSSIVIANYLVVAFTCYMYIDFVLDDKGMTGNIRQTICVVSVLHNEHLNGVTISGTYLIFSSFSLTPNYYFFFLLGH